MQPTKASFSHSQGLIDETIETGGVHKMLHIYPMCGILHFPSIDPDTLHFLAKYHSSGHNVKILHNGLMAMVQLLVLQKFIINFHLHHCDKLLGWQG